jgi:hypothetical protein
MHQIELDVIRIVATYICSDMYLSIYTTLVMIKRKLKDKIPVQFFDRNVVDVTKHAFILYKHLNQN